MTQTAPVIENENLLSLAQSADKETISAILEAFSESNGALYAELKNHILDSRFDEGARSAHGLKGSAANLGATAISEAARRLEGACKTGNAEEASKLLDTLPALFDQTYQEMNALVAAI